MDREKNSRAKLDSEKHIQIAISQFSSDILQYREHGKTLGSGAISGTSPT